MSRPALAFLSTLLALGASGHASAQDEPDPEATAHAPTSEDEAIPSPPPSVELRPATVRFRANVEGVGVRYLPDPILEEDAGALRIRVPADERYAVLCDAPCDRELPQTHLGLAAVRGATLVRFAEPLGVDGHTGVSIRWQDRDAERTAGIVTLAVGIPLGLLLAILPTSIELASGEPGAATIAGTASGALVVGLSIGLGITFSTMGDDASFEVVPLPDPSSALFSEEWR